MRGDGPYDGEAAGQKRRSPEDIVADILRSTQRSIPKTRIMYKAALNYKQLTKYLEILIKEGLLLQDPRSGRYRSSEKGTLYVERFEEFIRTREVILEKSKALRELLNHPQKAEDEGKE